MSGPPTPEIVLTVHDLVVRFELDNGRTLTVLNGVSFDVRRGETLVIMGGSGCGKSTLLNCLIGEIEPDEGAIVYHLPDQGAIDFARASEDQRDALRKRFGILFQSGALFSSLTVAENIALPLREHSHVPKEVIDIVVAMKLQQVRMLAHRNKHPAQLSGGQKKRAGLARATALDPEILFYDEPSAGLDPITTSTIDELIVDLSRKLHVTSVVVTHDMPSAFRIADRMIMLHAGRILRIAPRADFERLRNTVAEQLPPPDRLIRQFLLGETSGTMGDADGLGEYEKLLIGRTTATFTR